MKFHASAYFLILITFFNSCITLDDEFFPTLVNNTDTGKIYFYKDSINLDVTFRDNALIHETQVAFFPKEYISSSSVLGDFNFEQSFQNVNSRLFHFDTTLIVPAYVATGEYALIVKNVDKNNNTTVDTSFFRIEADSTAPVIKSFSLVTPIDENIEIENLCAGEKFVLKTVIQENLTLDNITLNFKGENEYNYDLSGIGSLSSEYLFKQEFFAPRNLEDNNLEVEFIIQDAYGNTSTTTYIIDINCDNQSSTLLSYKEASNITIPEDRMVQLYPGQLFSMKNLIFYDLGGLDSASLEVVRYDHVEDDFVETTIDDPKYFDLDNAIEKDLIPVFDNSLDYMFDAHNAQVDDSIKVKIKVKDQGQDWEKATEFSFTLVALEDIAPEIVINEVLIDGSSQDVTEGVAFDLTDILGTKDNVNIQFDGIFEEYVGLSSVTYSFRSDNGLIQSFGRTINLDGENLMYPLDIISTLNTDFLINSNENLTGKVTYYLDIKTTDIRNQTDEINYIFSVTY